MAPGGAQCGKQQMHLLSLSRQARILIAPAFLRHTANALLALSE